MSPDAAGLASVEREVSGRIMKTDVFVKIIGTQGRESQMTGAVDQVVHFFEGFEKRFSRFQDTSELTQFNRSTGGPVSAELFYLLRLCERYYQETEGIFDPSILPILQTIGYQGAALPESEAGQSVIFTELALDHTKRSATKPRSLMIDLGGIGKGVAVDQAVGLLRTAGYQDFIVDAGGDLSVGGCNREAGYPYWAIDVEDPNRRGVSIETILLSDEAVATSGRNRRCWKHNTTEYHHLIDPRRGVSSTNELSAVSVIAADTVTADVWAKTLFILGPRDGYQWAESRHLPALFLGRSGDRQATAEWESKRWSPKRVT